METAILSFSFDIFADKDNSELMNQLLQNLAATAEEHTSNDSVVNSIAKMKYELIRVINLETLTECTFGEFTLIKKNDPSLYFSAQNVKHYLQSKYIDSDEKDRVYLDAIRTVDHIIEFNEYSTHLEDNESNIMTHIWAAIHDPKRKKRAKDLRRILALELAKCYDPKNRDGVWNHDGVCCIVGRINSLIGVLDSVDGEFGSALKTEPVIRQEIIHKASVLFQEYFKTFPDHITRYNEENNSEISKAVRDHLRIILLRDYGKFVPAKKLTLMISEAIDWI